MIMNGTVLENLRPSQDIMMGVDKIKHFLKRMVVLFLISTILFSGCMSPENLVNSISTGTSLKIPPNEIRNINYSHVKPKIENEGYEFINNSKGNGDIISYISTLETNGSEIWINIWYKQSTSENYIKGTYTSTNQFSESKLEEKKAYVKSRVNEVAEVCNLTIDWSQVKWTVNYA